MKLLVTGGAGFIGSHTVDLCLSKGYEVVVIDNMSTGKLENLPKGIEFIEADIRNFDFESLEVNGIIHTAAMANLSASLTKPLEANDHNVAGTLRILEFARKRNIPMVLSSTSAIYGTTLTLPTNEEVPPSPLSPYGLQKLMCEQYMKLYNQIFGFRGIALRYMNVYGERQPDGGSYATVMGKFSKRFKAGQPFISIGDNQNRRDYVYVKDVADANLKALEYLFSGQGSFDVFNVGTGRNYSVAQIADLVTSNNTVWGEQLPERIEAKETLCDYSKIKRVLDWEPKINLENWIYDNR